MAFLNAHPPSKRLVLIKMKMFQGCLHHLLRPKRECLSNKENSSFILPESNREEINKPLDSILADFVVFPAFILSLIHQFS